ncbi:polyprenyl synthetase family protein [Streptomyces sp. NPDC026206]|uniref:polyprenyl synthetase family protein n=1 Tax=Streptomyces sp. NPDC026206 TaxID=3157089 RepID=UPI0033E74E0B
MTATMDALATPLDLSAVRRAVDDCLERFLDSKARAAAAQRMPTEVTEELSGFLFAGGKRLRPLLCVCGWRTGPDTSHTTAVVQTAASLEMFHAFALIHDDIMDRSATRRGRPTVHRALAAHHRLSRGCVAAGRLGNGAAILVGDLALAWSDELLHTAGMPQDRLTEVLPLIDTMRTEVLYGQYLDLLATGDLTGSADIPLRVIRYKTAKYTCERPLHIGATLAGADSRALESLSAYALPLGEAFQLRDDLLGVFGSPDTTGKSCLDDLREGKHTVLLALALRHADPAQRNTLRALVGNPDLDENTAARIRSIFVDTGARAAVERIIHSRYDQTRQALSRAAFPPPVSHALREIADAATARAA